MQVITVLSLGSNVGDRLNYLTLSKTAIQNYLGSIQLSSNILLNRNLNLVVDNRILPGHNLPRPRGPEHEGRGQLLLHASRQIVRLRGRRGSGSPQAL